MGMGFYFVWALAAAASTTVLSGHGLKVWKAPDELLIAALVVLGLQALGPPVRAWWRRFKGGATDHFRSSAFTTVLQAFLLLTSDEVGLTMGEVGVSVFVVQRKTASPWRPFLKRVAKVRPWATIAPSRITWRKNKGVIGRCWAEENPVVKYTRETYQPYLNAGEKGWEQAGEDVRMGLKFKEFQRIKGKYSAAVAVPIMSEKDGKVRFRGCVSADVRWDGNAQPLLTDEAVDILRDAAATLGNELAYISAWALVE